MPQEDHTWRVRPVDAGDEPRWRELFSAFRVHCGREPDSAVLDTVWSWITDPHHEVRGLIAANDEGEIGGIAHYRRFARSIDATHALFLDDLFTDERFRGQGIGRLLLRSLTDLAAQDGAVLVRWVTQPDNGQARGLCDSEATSSLVVYDMLPKHRQPPFVKDA